MIISSLLPKILIPLLVFKIPYGQITILVVLLFQCFVPVSAYEIHPRTSSEKCWQCFLLKCWTTPDDHKNDARSLSVQNSSWLYAMFTSIQSKTEDWPWPKLIPCTLISCDRVHHNSMNKPITQWSSILILELVVFTTVYLIASTCSAWCVSGPN